MLCKRTVHHGSLNRVSMRVTVRDRAIAVCKYQGSFSFNQWMRSNITFTQGVRKLMLCKQKLTSLTVMLHNPYYYYIYFISARHLLESAERSFYQLLCEQAAITGYPMPPATVFVLFYLRMDCLIAGIQSFQNNSCIGNHL